VKNRSNYDHILRSQGVPVFTFGELLHPAVYEADAATLKSAHFLSDHLLMIPLHQNLDVSIMTMICRKINTFFASVD
jgi:dTDP-4-amino-4,6-dideoxygalactose transaminase